MTSGDTMYAALVALGLSGLAVDGVVRIMPVPQTADLFEVHSIRIERDGGGANLWVDRTIHAPVTMAPVVRVLAWTDAGWRQTCFATVPPFQYQPEAVIDQPVTLDWWTWGQCPELPQGRARVVSTWTPHVRGADPISYSVEIAG